MKITRSMRRLFRLIADSISYLTTPAYIRAQRDSALRYENMARSAYERLQREHLEIKTPMIASNTVFCLLKFDAVKADPYSVHHLMYKQRPMAIDTAIAWILSQYEAQGYTVEDIESMRSKVAVQEMIGHQGFLSDYILVVSDDGNYWVQITATGII